MFHIGEDFFEIIGGACGEKPRALRMIPTAWTNIVFEGELFGATRIFRFPRNSFWAEMMPKDYAFSAYVMNKTSFRTPDIKLFNDPGGRVFSVHEKIPGRMLTDALGEMSEVEIMRAAGGAVRFVKELSSLSVDDAPAECKMPLSEFWRKLAERFLGGLMPKYFERLFRAEKNNPTMAHGDFNPGNIILDDDFNVVGVIDFCFAGVGGGDFDLSRIIGRATPSFARAVAEIARPDMQKIAELIEIWRWVEAGYIEYIKQNNPEIKLPDGV
jgi:tRNA A-37 threonylcarbamoyl transferase component Bud32